MNSSTNKFSVNNLDIWLPVILGLVLPWLVMYGGVYTFIDQTNSQIESVLFFDNLAWKLSIIMSGIMTLGMFFVQYPLIRFKYFSTKESNIYIPIAQ